MSLSDCQQISPITCSDIEKRGNVYPFKPRMNINERLRQEDSTNIHILQVISEKEKAGTREVSEAVHMSRSAVLKRIKGLAEKGFLVKEVERLPATGIKPAFVFCLAPGVPVVEIQALYQLLVQSIQTPDTEAQLKLSTQTPEVVLPAPVPVNELKPIDAIRQRILNAEDSGVTSKDLEIELQMPRRTVYDNLNRLVDSGEIKREESVIEGSRVAVYFPPEQEPSLKRISIQLPVHGKAKLVKLQSRTFEVLKILAVEDSAVVADLSKRLAETRGNIHTSLQQLIKIGLVAREERTTRYGREHVYFIPANVSSSKIITAIHQVDLEGSTEMPALPSHQSQESADSQVAHKPSTSDILVQKLPEFDSNWPAEVQAKWFESYQRLIDMSQGK